MSWTPAILPILVAIGLLIVPGLAVSWCLRLRSFSGIALAPVFSTSIVGVTGIIGGWSGVPWTLGHYLAGTVAAALLALVTAKLVPMPEFVRVPKSERNWSWIPTLMAVTAATVLIAWRLMQLFQSPENVSQRFDNVFHLNAIRFILDSGDASSLNLGSMSGATGLAAVYPASWHSFAAMVSQITGASVPMAVNSFNLVFSSIAWPLGCVMLARQVVGRELVATLAAGVLSAAQLSFPALLLVWGPLYPNALSLALLPAVIASIVALAGLGRADKHASSIWWATIALSLPGLATAHTSSLNALLVFTLPILIFSLITKVRQYGLQKPRWHRVALLGALAAVVASLYTATWIKLRPGFYDHWGPHQTEGGAIGEAITSAPVGTSVAWTVTVLMVIGFITAWSQPSWRWIPFSYAISVALYVVDASMPRGDARAFFTGVWYQDTYRLAAFLPLFTTLLASLGAAALAQKLNSWAFRRPSAKAFYGHLQASPIRIASSGVFILALAAASQYGALRQYVVENKVFYNLDASSPMLSTDEAKLLKRIPESVPPDAVIAGNPWNGSSLAYAISGRKVLVHHLHSELTPEQEVITRDLGTDASDATVCPAVSTNNVQFVLDFGDSYLATNEASSKFPGVTDVSISSRLKLIDSEGAAKLYRVVGCN